MGVEQSRQDHLSLTVDDVVEAFGGNIASLSDGRKTAIVDRDRAVPNDTAISIDCDEVIDVSDEERRHALAFRPSKGQQAQVYRLKLFVAQRFRDLHVLGCLCVWL
ncbi:MAG TPA: hypothetical protein VFL19_01795 [Nitrospira sp.]|nr:hypothetical protein [Nitrospira sp.]